jgi:hypothetical protein
MEIVAGQMSDSEFREGLRGFEAADAKRFFGNYGNRLQ